VVDEAQPASESTVPAPKGKALWRVLGGIFYLHLASLVLLVIAYYAGATFLGNLNDTIVGWVGWHYLVLLGILSACALQPEEQRREWFTPWVKFFISVQVAVVTLILLATISIIGTVLQQENIGDIGDNLTLFQQFFGDAGRARRAFDISDKIGFFNLYHTWYFYALLGLLSTSLIVCSLRRLPQTWRIMAHPKVELDESGFKASPNRRSLSMRPAGAEAGEAVKAILRKGGFRLRESERDGVRYLFGQKGAYSRLGIYTTHFSIIMIFIGGIIGSVYGFKGYMQITEGETSSQFALRGVEQKIGRLPFEVRCDDFTVENYPGSGRPKDFFSQLTVIDGARRCPRRRSRSTAPSSTAASGSTSRATATPAAG